MVLFSTSLALLLCSALAAGLFSRSRIITTKIVPLAVLLACAAGAMGAVSGLLLGEPETFRVAWSLPFAAIVLHLDRLSCFFLLILFVISGLLAVYGREYLESYRERKNIGLAWLFFSVLIASMALVFVAANAVLFLVVWELMALSSFFLVLFEDEKDSVRRAGLIYIVATQLGTAFLTCFFLVLAKHAGSFDFDRLLLPGQYPAEVATAAFILAVLGFGSKAGFMPLHVWLPEAHPVAPSHVSALMSGVMIKTGIYGLIRALQFLGTPPEWWGTLLVGVGAVSAIGGVLFAAAQQDLKKLLAYSSVENVGIILLGIGISCIGQAVHSPLLQFFGMAGALLHVLNHACFKSLLFLGAGSILHATGTRDLDLLGGLSRRMPLVSMTFLVGAVAISGIPPLNGFVGEFLIYYGAYVGGMQHAQSFSFLVVIFGLATVGGLALAAFTKAFGVAFLGTPRSERSAHAHDPGWEIRGPLIILACACVVIGLGAPWVASGMASIVDNVYPGLSGSVDLAAMIGPLQMVSGAGAGFIVLVALLALIRKSLLRGRVVTEAETWGCGYDRPSPRMQYTGSSFSQPITLFFSGFLKSESKAIEPAGYFPATGEFESHTPDAILERIYIRALHWIDRRFGYIRKFQYGRMQLYILYIVLTLMLLLAWQVGLGK